MFHFKQAVSRWRNRCGAIRNSGRAYTPGLAISSDLGQSGKKVAIGIGPNGSHVDVAWCLECVKQNRARWGVYFRNW
jgi:hypothetical protein